MSVSGTQQSLLATPPANADHADAPSEGNPSSARQISSGVSGWEVSDFAQVSTLVNHIIDPHSSLAHRVDDWNTLDKLCEKPKYESVRGECNRLRPMLNSALPSQYKSGLLTKDEILTIDILALPD